MVIYNIEMVNLLDGLGSLLPALEFANKIEAQAGDIAITVYKVGENIIRLDLQRKPKVVNTP